MPGNGRACATCNGRKVGCSFAKRGLKSTEYVVDSDEGTSTPRQKKPKTSGTRPVTGKMSVKVGPSKDSSAETVAVLREQNDVLRRIIDTQKPILDSAMNQMWLGRELVRHVSWIADALEVMAPLSSSWGSSEYWNPEPSSGEGSERSEGSVSGPRVDKGRQGERKGKGFGR
jgi:hypothetical protein